MVRNQICSARVAVVWNSVTTPQSTMQNHLHLYGMSVTYTRWVHHGEAMNVNVIDYVEAAYHHLDLPDAQVEEEEEVVVIHQ